MQEARNLDFQSLCNAFYIMINIQQVQTSWVYQISFQKIRTNQVQDGQESGFQKIPGVCIGCPTKDKNQVCLQMRDSQLLIHLFITSKSLSRHNKQ